jgi:steroid delta-isomerase-like uncharacterized protein
MAGDIAQVGEDWFEAWNQREFDRGSALVADGAEIVEVPTNETFSGPEGSRAESEKWANGLPDGRVTVNNRIASDRAVVLENSLRGTHTGPFVTPEGEIPATGRSLDYDFCTVLEIDQGKIQGIRHYFDLATMMRQLGLG